MKTYEELQAELREARVLAKETIKELHKLEADNYTQNRVIVVLSCLLSLAFIAIYLLWK